jgi:hypothetical protein
VPACYLSAADLHVRDQDEALKLYVDAAARADRRGLPRRLRADARPRGGVHSGAAERYGTVDAGFRDPPGNGWKMIEGRR